MNFVTYWLYSASSLAKTGYFFNVSWARVSPRVWATICGLTLGRRWIHGQVSASRYSSTDKFLKRKLDSNKSESSENKQLSRSESTSVGRKAQFRRLYCDDCSKFEFHWTGDEQMPSPLCVVCGQKLCNETTVSSKLRRHFITNHSHLQTKTIVYFQRLLQANSRQGKYFRKKWLCQNELN